MSIDLSTQYLGLDLASPLMPGASPLCDNLDCVRRLEDAGAGAIVLHSLFEEDIRHAELRASQPPGSPLKSISFAPPALARDPEEYMALVRRTAHATTLPVIASLNGRAVGEWVQHAHAIEEAGADALELNLYFVSTDLHESGADVEARCLDIIEAVRTTVSIPVAVKLAPFFSSFANFAHRVDTLAVDGIVLFNRFFQPDIDESALAFVGRIEPSTPADLRIRLRWTALLAGRLRGSIAISGGVHSPEDVVKALLAGADAVQVVSVLMLHGPAHLGVLRDGLVAWMRANGHESLSSVRGRLALAHEPNPAGLERAAYLGAVHSRVRQP